MIRNNNMLIESNDSYNDLYDAIRKNNNADALLAAQTILLTTKSIQPLARNVKNEIKSDSFRKEGNAAYVENKYQLALILYNKALLFAPKRSRAMKLAYSNRSALLFTAKYYCACLEDIDTCFAMGCPSDVHDKLSERKQEALKHALNEKLSKDIKLVTITEELMKPKTSNPDIPNASCDIKVIATPDGPMVVAARNIDVGTILANEYAFVSSTHPDNNFFSCYYCHKMPLVLIPCDECCFALFCNESCQQKSMEEHHKVICPIIDMLNLKQPDVILATKALVKLRQTSKSWEELITMSHGIDGNGSRKGASAISNLIVKENKHFIVGTVFDLSFNNATVLHHLDSNTDFFPRSPVARAKAIRAASTILMNLSVYAKYIMLYPPVTGNTKKTHQITVNNHVITNYGLYSFIGKLKRTCLSNVNTVAIHRDIVLVSIMPIKKDTEITNAHMSLLWSEENFKKHKRQQKMYFSEKYICICEICRGDFKTQTLTQIQAKKFLEINPSGLERDCNPEDFFCMFKKICETMKALSDTPFSEEYFLVYAIFKKCLLYFQCVIACNFMFLLDD